MTKSFPHRRVWTGVLIAAIVAAVINSIIFFVGNALVAEPIQVTFGANPELQDLTVWQVILATVIPAIGAGLTYSVIGLFSKRATMIFLIVGALLLLISFAPPLTLSVAASAKVVLVLMHLVAACTILYTLSTSTK